MHMSIGYQYAMAVFEKHKRASIEPGGAAAGFLDDDLARGIVPRVKGYMCKCVHLTYSNGAQGNNRGAVAADLTGTAKDLGTTGESLIALTSAGEVNLDTGKRDGVDAGHSDRAVVQIRAGALFSKENAHALGSRYTGKGDPRYSHSAHNRSSINGEGH